MVSTGGVTAAITRKGSLSAIPQWRRNGAEFIKLSIVQRFPDNGGGTEAGISVASYPGHAGKKRVAWYTLFAHAREFTE